MLFAVSNSERQEYVFTKICNILYTDFQFEAKPEARQFFNELRQLTLDWNYINMGTDEFIAQEKKIDSHIQSKKKA